MAQKITVPELVMNTLQKYKSISRGSRRGTFGTFRYHKTCTDFFGTYSVCTIPFCMAKEATAVTNFVKDIVCSNSDYWFQ